MLAPQEHEAEVAARFDLLQGRFKAVVGEDDVRWRALRACLGPVAGRRVLDLGCGKGRFARRLAGAGADVVGLDRSAAMLRGADAGAGGAGLRCVRGSARRLPFASSSFEAVVAVEVFEHLAAIDAVLHEVRRVLRPGGLLAIVDKNAGSWNARRPWLPNLAVKWLDERRGRWMYPAGGPVRERWFWPGAFRRRLARHFGEARVTFLISPGEAGHPLFERVPGARMMTLWSARVPVPVPGDGGGDRV
jgi:2-polyprenyl-6-hydroxyphenyl methylase/3-demethylubiquinone-9 3-methyltransferase